MRNSILFLGLGLLLTACAYRWGFARPEGVKSVAVQVFENETFRRGVEVSLAEEISKEVSERSGLLLSAANEADALIRGKIENIADNVMLEGPSRQVRSAIVWIQIQAELVDRKSGKVLRSVTLQDRGQYLTDNLQDRDTATEKAVRRLAQKVVFSLASATPES